MKQQRKSRRVNGDERDEDGEIEREEETKSNKRVP